MNAARLLEDLRPRGVQLFIKDGQLTCRGPVGSVSDAEFEAIRLHKDDLLALLRRPADSDLERFLAWGAGVGRIVLKCNGFTVKAGQAEWEEFASTCTRGQLAEAIALLELDAEPNDGGAE